MFDFFFFFGINFIEILLINFLYKKKTVLHLYNITKECLGIL